MERSDRSRAEKMAGILKAWPTTLLLLLGFLLSADIIDPVNGEMADPPRRLLSKMKYSIGFGTHRILQLPALPRPKNLSSDEEKSGSNKEIDDGIEDGIDGGIDEKESPAESSKFQSRHLLVDGQLLGRPTPSGKNPPPPTPRSSGPRTPPSS